MSLSPLALEKIHSVTLHLEFELLIIAIKIVL
jgi:hypothetical protein